MTNLVLTRTNFSHTHTHREEAFYRPPYHDLRHPMIFYYVHPAALYVNKLRVAGVLPAGINDYYEHIFETVIAVINAALTVAADDDCENVDDYSRSMLS